MKKNTKATRPRTKTLVVRGCVVRIQNTRRNAREIRELERAESSLLAADRNANQLAE